MDCDKLNKRIDDIEKELNFNIHTIKQMTLICMVFIIGILAELWILSCYMYLIGQSFNTVEVKKHDYLWHLENMMNTTQDYYNAHISHISHIFDNYTQNFD